MRFTQQAAAVLLCLAGSAEGFGIAPSLSRSGSQLLTTTSPTKQSRTRSVLQCSTHNHGLDDRATIFMRKEQQDNVEDDDAVSQRQAKSTSASGLFRRAFDRSTNLMEKAGLPNALEQRNPLKNPIVFLFVVLLAKYLRAKFIMKGQSSMNEFQPAWGHVITSKEQEKSLHAYECQKCGTTVFIAKGREFRFFNKFVKCLNCGATGQKNFKDMRDDIVEQADDGEFVYESPVNYKLSKREKRKLEEAEAKEAEERKAAEEAEANAKAKADADADAMDAEVVDDVEVAEEAEVPLEEKKEEETPAAPEATTTPAPAEEPVAEKKEEETPAKEATPEPVSEPKAAETPKAATPQPETPKVVAEVKEATPEPVVEAKVVETPKAAPAAPKPAAKPKPVSRAPPAPSGDDMDILDMD